MCLCICAEVDLSCFPCSSSPYFSIQGLSLDMEFAISASLAGQQVPRVCLSLLPNTYIYTAIPSVDAGDLNSGPHTCIASSQITVSSQSYRAVKTSFFWSTVPCYFVSILAELGLEPGDSCVLGKCFKTEV